MSPIAMGNGAVPAAQGPEINIVPDGGAEANPISADPTIANPMAESQGDGDN
jgi:hypothetical protein